MKYDIMRSISNDGAIRVELTEINLRNENYFKFKFNIENVKFVRTLSNRLGLLYKYQWVRVGLYKEEVVTVALVTQLSF